MKIDVVEKVLHHCICRNWVSFSPGESFLFLAPPHLGKSWNPTYQYMAGEEAIARRA